MLRRIRARLTYANVMSTLAVFIALGGSSYAALSIGTKEIKNGAVRSVDLRNNDIRGKDVRNGTLTGADVKRDALGGTSILESQLGKVPSAVNADLLDGRTADQLRVRCPGGTVARAGLCFEANSSRPLTFLSAQDQCTFRGRAIPTWDQLRNFVSSGQFPLSAGGELTSSVFGLDPQALVLVTPGGTTTSVNALTTATRAYRCVALPSD